MLKKHFELLIKDKNEIGALLEIRSHAIWYMKGITGGAKIKNMICSARTTDEVFKILDEFLESTKKGDN
jgi:tRNA-dihydrouridine synthase